MQGETCRLTSLGKQQKVRIKKVQKRKEARYITEKEQSAVQQDKHVLLHKKEWVTKPKLVYQNDDNHQKNMHVEF